jgi:predicted fused transcriptional regulator/phosphomethylpyrimidine kinase
MTTSDLTWGKTKDGILMGVGALLVSLLLFILKGQAESNATLAEVKRDLAVYSSESKRNREDVADLQGRVRSLEVAVARMPEKK